MTTAVGARTTSPWDSRTPIPGVTRRGPDLPHRVLVGSQAGVVTLTWTVALLVAAPRLWPSSATTSERAALWASTVALGIHLVRRSSRGSPLLAAGLDALHLAETARVAVLTGLWAAFAATPLGVEVRAPVTLAAVLGVLAGLAACRLAVRGWLTGARTAGRHLTPALIVGAGTEAADLHQLVGEHPELGLVVVDQVGLGGDRRAGGGGVDLQRLRTSVARSGVRHVILAGSSLSVADTNTVVRLLLHLGVHVHVSSGLRGIDSRRVRSQSVAYQPMLYVAPRSSRRGARALKRLLDVLLAGAALLLSLPLLALAMLAIRLEDGGPALFRQTRVGRGGREFAMLKLRTMVVDAESRMAALRAGNQRTGPLFKLATDPRVTRVGRLLRVTSLDELPQLVNVLRGEMSLVGPRPALPAEAAAFDGRELEERCSVRPGITGLWQVEARDNPLFSLYVRLDRFYIDNWSTWLDLAILVCTAQAQLVRLVRVLRPTGGAGSAVLE